MEKAEQWRPIPGFGGWYELSRHGEIRSWYTTGPGKQRREKPLILRPFMNWKGTVITYYRSMAEVAEKNHISRSGMQKRINNETLADGVVFRRASELEG